MPVLKRKFPCSLHLNVQNGLISGVVIGGAESFHENVWELDWSRISPFARSVYEALMDLGVGETVTYGEIASRIGKPGSARAVGSACKRNPFPIIIPCHRVVRSDGFGEFAYGSTLKERLLEFERSQ